ncbi:MAG: hypothetical protein INQ03_16930 [Candidatus Heimdallarchaeota archaeon]|nr:hypothetical protein [Candidatus Heimdallarchaeota archaeon]
MKKKQVLFMGLLLSIGLSMQIIALPNGLGMQKENGHLVNYDSYLPSKGRTYYFYVDSYLMLKTGSWLTLSGAVYYNFDLETEIDDAVEFMKTYIGDHVDFYITFNGELIPYTLDGWSFENPYYEYQEDSLYMIIIYHYNIPPQPKGGYEVFGQAIWDGQVFFESTGFIEWVNLPKM